MSISSFGFPSLPPSYSNDTSNPAAGPASGSAASQGIPGLAPNIQAQTSVDTMLISSLQQTSGFGFGVNSDLYTAIGRQSMGYLSGSRTAFELADISLGIDNSQKDYLNPIPTQAPSAASSAAAVGAQAAANAPQTSTGGETDPAMPKLSGYSLVPQSSTTGTSSTTTTTSEPTTTSGATDAAGSTSTTTTTDTVPSESNPVIVYDASMDPLLNPTPTATSGTTDTTTTTA